MSRDPHPFRPPHQSPAPTPLDPEVQRRKDALAYLTSERGYIAARTAQGMYPYSYLPTAWGNVGYGLTVADFTSDELVAYADAMWAYVYTARNNGDAEDEAKCQAVLAIIMPELAARGVAYTPPADQARAPKTVPGVPHPDGR